MGLFSNLYNSIAKFFQSQEGDPSKAVAANRLKLVLMQDRTNLTPKVLEQMRGELINLLSKYLEMDKDLLELNFEQEGDQVALMLSIPVIRAKDESEIEINTDKENDSAQGEGDDEDNKDESDEEEPENNEEAGENSEQEPENSSDYGEQDTNAVKLERKRRSSKKVTHPAGNSISEESNNDAGGHNFFEENSALEQESFFENTEV